MAPKAPSGKPASYYKSILVCTITWIENDFKTTKDQSVKQETEDFRTFCKNELNATVAQINLESKTGSESEEQLLTKLQKFYDTKTQDADAPALAILVYSGHGANGPVDPAKIPGAKYTPRGDSSLGPRVTVEKAKQEAAEKAKQTAPVDKKVAEKADDGPTDSLNGQVKDREFQRVLWYE